MKPSLFFLLFFFTFNLKAQKHTGVNFENGLSWMQIKEKAKKENKYIFLDGYTTWCVPCKQMDTNIFPQQKVADFFNQNFINVAVQFDVTKNDGKNTRAWYEDAKAISKTYKIDSYPTYLFFNPQGILVHSIKGGDVDADSFLMKAKKALDPKSQYLNLKRQYTEGKRDTAFILMLINSASEVRDDQSKAEYINAYLAVQKNLLTKQNLKFVAQGTTKSSDIGFNILLNYPKQIDSVVGKGDRIRILNTIAFDEIILPRIRIDGKKTVYGGGMVVYSGEMNKDVDWTVIKQELDLKYPYLSDEIILKAKPEYYRALNDWERFCQSVSLHTIGKEPNVAAINRYANEVFLFCDDLKYITEAIKWSKLILSNENSKNSMYLATYSHLLYKFGQKDLAINIMQEVLKLEPNNDRFIGELRKMKMGEMIW
ncbi:thioredoxin-related protein [Pedobacter africanus]|uniref:Thioredoxin-related protein n=1 Tax=Pedobacter africanus TaxID=151894 RepID=A0ACC6KWZ9_9SPHI|nr:thioredoxin fold domain-containing protein [Pedobacter africanus]MDR6783913.1 thioredoxin-related protein [Pedobacter africanus]